MGTAGRNDFTGAAPALYRVPGTAPHMPPRTTLCAAARMAPHMAPSADGGRCSRCGMAFREEAPPPAATAAAGAGGVEILRCPDCGRRFWADPDGPGGRCAVGLLPEARR